jgi:hypothetical protein
MQNSIKVVKIKETKVIELIWNPNVRCSSPLSEEIEPLRKLYNIVKNAALLPGGSFISGNGNVVVQICDIVGNTLQKTHWTVPQLTFNEVVTQLTWHEEMDESLFYTVAKC